MFGEIGQNATEDRNKSVGFLKGFLMTESERDFELSYVHRGSERCCTCMCECE